jgi:hypothetical protein
MLIILIIIIIIIIMLHGFITVYISVQVPLYFSHIFQKISNWYIYEFVLNIT